LDEQTIKFKMTFFQQTQLYEWIAVQYTTRQNYIIACVDTDINSPGIRIQEVQDRSTWKRNS